MQTANECSTDGCTNNGVCVGYYKHYYGPLSNLQDIDPYYQCDIHFGLAHDLTCHPNFFHQLGMCSIPDCTEWGNFYGIIYQCDGLYAHVYKCSKHVGVIWEHEWNGMFFPCW